MDETLPDAAAPPEPPLPPPPPAPRLPFRLPADYYGSPDAPPRALPRAVPFGCGTASIVLLVALFIAAAFADRFMPAIFGVMQSEIDGQFTKDVTPAQRAAFDKEFSALIEKLRHGKTSVAGLRPLLEKMRDAGADEKVTPEETKALTEQLHQVNAAGKR